MKNKKSKSSTILALTAMADTVEDLMELVKLSRLGVSKIKVWSLFPVEKHQTHQSLLYNRKTANQVFKKAKKLGKKLGVEVIAKKFDLGSIEKPEQKIKKNLIPCHMPWTTINIRENGDITPCACSTRIMGNLKKRSFNSIWNN